MVYCIPPTNIYMVWVDYIVHICIEGHVYAFSTIKLLIFTSYDHERPLHWWLVQGRSNSECTGTARSGHFKKFSARVKNGRVAKLFYVLRVKLKVFFEQGPVPPQLWSKNLLSSWSKNMFTILKWWGLWTCFIFGIFLCSHSIREGELSIIFDCWH